QRPRLAQLEGAAPLRGREERLAVADDHRIDEEPKLVHETRVDEARRRAAAADQIDVLAGLTLQRRDVVERAEEFRVRPSRRIQLAREHVVRGPLAEAPPLDLRLRRDFAFPERLFRLLLYRRPVALVLRIHAGPEQARVDLRRQAIVLRPRVHPVRAALGGPELSVYRNL